MDCSGNAIQKQLTQTLKVVSDFVAGVFARVEDIEVKSAEQISGLEQSIQQSSGTVKEISREREEFVDTMKELQTKADILQHGVSQLILFSPTSLLNEEFR